uniref:PTBP1-like RNA recognition motif 2 domain-containing protein n=1 Tax=Arundo donax TaxID=35708 RepID=A0A0A8XZ31_ARUDO
MLNGRNIYDGCCQLQIEYAIVQGQEIGSEHHMFDKMASHQKVRQGGVLQVTVSRVLHPVTNDVLWQVFGVYGVQRISMFQRGTDVEACVKHWSEQEAERAQDATHGRCIYDGCCVLDVQCVSPIPSGSATTTFTRLMATPSHDTCSTVMARRCSTACLSIATEPDHGVTPFAVHAITTGATSISSKPATEPSTSPTRCLMPRPCSDNFISSSTVDTISTCSEPTTVPCSMVGGGHAVNAKSGDMHAADVSMLKGDASVVILTPAELSRVSEVKSLVTIKLNTKVHAGCFTECLGRDVSYICVIAMSRPPTRVAVLIPVKHPECYFLVFRPPPQPPWAPTSCCHIYSPSRTQPTPGRPPDSPSLTVCNTKEWLLLSWSPPTHQCKVKRIGIQILYQLGELWESCFYLPDQVVCAKSMSVKMLDWSENSCNWTQPTQRCRFKFIQFAECNQYKLRPISIRIQFGEAQKYFFNLPTVCELIINWWHVQFRSKLRHQNVGAIHQKLHWESSERYIILINLGGQVATLLHFLTERLWYAVTLSLGFLSAHQRKTILLRPWPPPPKHAVLLLWYVKWARLNSSRIAVVHADLKLLKSSAALQMLRFGISGERRESVEQENFDLIPYLICATACPTDNLFFKPPQALVEFLLTNVIDALDMLALDTSWNYWSICLTAMLIQIASNGIEVLLLLQLSDQSQGAFEVTVPLCYADQNVREQVPLKPWACIQWKSVGAWTGLNTSIGCQWRDQPTRSMEELSNPWDPGGFNDSGLGASRVSRGGDVMDPGSPRAARLQTTKDWAAWAGL